MLTPVFDHPLALADEYFFLAYSEITGRARRDSNVAAVGLGAAMLAELVLVRRIEIGSAGVVFVYRPQPDARQGLPDAVMQVYRHLLAEPVPLPVAAWLRRLAPVAYEWAGARLRDRGLVTVVLQRRWFRGDRVSFQPVNTLLSGQVQLTLYRGLVGAHPMSLTAVAVAGLAKATDLLGCVLRDPETAATGEATAAAAVDALRSSEPSLHALIAHTGATADAVTLAPH